MCLVSDKIKFCTCGATDISSLKHYWVLYSWNKHQNIMVIGDAVLPLDFDIENEKLNAETLHKRVNEAAAFDVELHSPQRNGILLL